ncbi:MFS transporter [Actinacidiphila soli]|uniref:hypothetical protein n=1 Tax=Actinacidiphila soli TaxID=2487275 RepID=UPI003898ECA6
MPALIMGAVPPSETAAANGLNTLMRSIGTSTSSAVVGVVLAHMTITLGEGTSAAVVPSMDGFRTAFAIACLVGVVTLAVGVFIPGKTVEGRTAFTVRPSTETEAEASASEPQMLTPKS